MAGGRSTKRTAKRETKSKRIQNEQKEKATAGEELKDEQSTAAKIVSEKDKCIPQDDKQKGDSSVESSSLLSKYVPPFSRTGKNSSKSEGESLTRSQSTRKRRNEGSSSVESEKTTKTEEAACKETELINVENSPSTSKLNVEDYNSQTSQNNIKEVRS